MENEVSLFLCAIRLTNRIPGRKVLRRCANEINSNNVRSVLLSQAAFLCLETGYVPN